MISKKILLLLCIGITSLSYCMEVGMGAEQKENIIEGQKSEIKLELNQATKDPHEENSYRSQEGGSSDGDDAQTEAGIDESNNEVNDSESSSNQGYESKKLKAFRNKLKRLISYKDEQAIIAHLKAHPHFTITNKDSIFELISENKFSKVFVFLFDFFKDMGYITAFDEIEKIKELIKFNENLTEGILSTDFARFLALNLCDIMGKILLHDKINYKLDNGDRYLQKLILTAKNQDQELVDIIANFIKLASPNELNAQDSEGNTALHVATRSWYIAQIAKNEGNAKNQKHFIKALLKHGANPYLLNNEREQASDSRFFNKNAQQWRLWQMMYEFNTFLTDKNQENIKELLEKNPDFAEAKKMRVFYESYRANFDEVISYMQKYNISNADLIAFALKHKDFEMAKQIIQFNRFIVGGNLDIAGLKLKLQELLIKKKKRFIDAIIVRDKVNYQDTDGNRCLQKFIQERKIDLALEFIESASLDQLNAQDAEGNTALNIAAQKWDEIPNENPENIAGRFELIIRNLIKKGADISIANSEGKSLKDSDYFESYPKKVIKWKLRYREAMQIRQGQKKQSYFGTKTKMALAAISVAGIGVAAYYFGNKYFNKNINSTIKVK